MWYNSERKSQHEYVESEETDAKANHIVLYCIVLYCIYLHKTT